MVHPVFLVARYLLLSINGVVDGFLLLALALWLYGCRPRAATQTDPWEPRPASLRVLPPLLLPAPTPPPPPLHPKFDPWEDHYEAYETMRSGPSADRHADCVLIKSAQARCDCGWKSQVWNGGQSSGMAQLDWVQHKASYATEGDPEGT